MFDSILRMNLTGEDKELFYLTEYLGVKALSSASVQSLFREDLLELFKNVRSKTSGPICGKQKSKEAEEISEKGDPFEPAEPADLADPLDTEEAATETAKQPGDRKRLQELEPLPISHQTSISFILDRLGKETAFFVVGLPENYYDCYSSYIYQSCEICQKSQRTTDLVVCLICGKQMCSNVCPGQDAPMSERRRRLS